MYQSTNSFTPFLIEVFGLDQTAKIAAALNIIAAVVAVTLLKEVKVNKKEEETPTEEITKDIIAIMNVYVAKINGLRKYKK